MADAKRDTGPIVIKKYANRRLYNTATSSYVTLEHLAQMVRDGTDFQVFDAKTNEDITRQVLTHIIVEEENKGENMLPLSFLRQLIALYGDSVQAMVPGYLEQSMKAFAGNQDQIREMMEKTFGQVMSAPGFGGQLPEGNPIKAFEDMARQNMALFENALKTFNPFAGAGAGAAPTSAKASDGGDDMEAMRDQLNKLQAQLDKLSKKG
ncbi:MAG TPA: polyhydroxyalkanoate synthesis repressor PhaR [Magnetovibrio sp.]